MAAMILLRMELFVTEPIKISNFIGMNNIKVSESLTVGKAGACQFCTILNSDSLAVSCTIALRF